MVGPEAFTEVKYLAASQQLRVLDEIPCIAEAFERATGRASGGLVSSYRMDGAEIAVVAMGSVLGSVKDVVDELREVGAPIGVVAVSCYRPWPLDEVRAALAGLEQVVVLNRAFAVGSGTMLGQDVRLTLAASAARVYDVVAGLGGRPVTHASIRSLVEAVLGGEVDPDRLHFLDLDQDVVARELGPSLAVES
jgi:pyruvate ferredoxin oxidoreductase alpha subunit